MIRVLLVGAIAQPNTPAVGGHEAANRRTIDGLRKLGLPVTELAYPRLGLRGQARRWLRLPAYLARWLSLVLRFTVRLSWSRPDLVHMPGFYRRFVYLEALLLLVAKVLRVRFIYDVRAGAAVWAWERNGRAYRRAFRFLLKNSDSVMVEGREYEPFFLEISQRRPYYLPNYVEASVLENGAGAGERESEPLRLVYFGRLAASKGLAVILDCAGRLSDGGVSFGLRLIGEEEAGLLKQISGELDRLDLRERVEVSPPMKFSELAEVLRRSHFFLFPTSYAGEGHSNSLTEAMACGVVPVCSRHGFNVSVVGPCGAVLPASASGDDYARAIREIWESGRWPELSQCGRERVARLFCADAVLPSLVAHYERVLRRESPAGQGAG